MGRATDRRGVLRIDLDAAADGPGSGAGRTRWPWRSRWRSGWAGRAGRRRPLAVTMRTPGDDLDLAIGLPADRGADPRRPTTCSPPSSAPGPRRRTRTTWSTSCSPPACRAPATDPTRNFYTTSSCGVCGKASIDAVRTRSRFDVAADPLTVPAAAAGRAARPAARRAARLRPHRRPARGRPVHRRRRAAWCCARTSAGTTRWTR